MFRRRSTRFALNLALVAVLASDAANADDAAAADALFQAGRRAMQQQDYVQAAARFAESQRLEPAPGTLLNLALAEEKVGRLASAWEHARSVAAALPRSDERQAIAQQLHEGLDRRVPRIVLEGESLPEDARVTLDGLALTRASFGIPLPVDIGRHRVVLEAPGHLRQAMELDLREGTVTRRSLELRTPVDTPAVRPVPTKRPLRTAGWVTLGSGVVATGVGSIFGLMAIDRNRVVEAQCEGGFCTSEGVSAASDGRTYATASTVSFIAAGALVVSGVLLVLLAPRAP